MKTCKDLNIKLCVYCAKFETANCWAEYFKLKIKKINNINHLLEEYEYFLNYKGNVRLDYIYYKVIELYYPQYLPKLNVIRLLK